MRRRGGESDEDELHPEHMLPAHVPSVHAFHSLIHTYAVAGRLRCAYCLEPPADSRRCSSESQ